MEMVSRGCRSDIPRFCRPMECSANAFVVRGVVLQHAEVSAFSRLPSHDARAVTHPAGIARQSQSERGLSRILLVYGRVPLVLLCSTYLSHSHLAIVIALAFHQPILARLRDRRFRDKARRLWSRPAFYLRHVDSGGGDSLPALPVVHGIPEPPSGLDLAELSVMQT